jgi:hypothetical protein
MLLTSVKLEYLTPNFTVIRDIEKITKNTPVGTLIKSKYHSGIFKIMRHVVGKTDYVDTVQSNISGGSVGGSYICEYEDCKLNTPPKTIREKSTSAPKVEPKKRKRRKTKAAPKVDKSAATTTRKPVKSKAAPKTKDNPKAAKEKQTIKKKEASKRKKRTSKTK